MVTEPGWCRRRDVQSIAAQTTSPHITSLTRLSTYRALDVLFQLHHYWRVGTNARKVTLKYSLCFKDWCDLASPRAARSANARQLPESWTGPCSIVANWPRLLISSPLWTGSVNKCNVQKRSVVLYLKYRILDTSNSTGLHHEPWTVRVNSHRGGVIKCEGLARSHQVLPW